MHAQAGDSNYLVNKDLNFIYKRQTISCVRANFFSKRVINCWNSLPHTVDLVPFQSSSVP